MAGDGWCPASAPAASGEKRIANVDFRPLRSRPLLPLLLCAALGAACAEDPARKAREELARLDIPWSESAFVECVRRGDAYAVKLYLRAGMSPDAVGARGLTALMWASYHGRTDTVKLLLERGADANLRAGDGTTALQGAVEGVHVEIVRMLLDRGAEVTGPALEKAVTANLVNTVELMLSRGGRPELSESETRPLLSIAARYGHLEMARMLIARGADVHARDADGRTALEKAVLYGHPEVADMLRRSGARE
jgi:cytohesin